jgi:hypothetical protein
MTKITRQQRVAIKRIFDRCPIIEDGRQISYRQFRKTVQPTFGCDGAVVVYWAEMWLCIERNGYVHS